MEYSIICVFTSEEARWEGKPLAEAITRLLQTSQLAARCLVTRAIAGSYENGDMATQRIEVLSYNMPLKIEIILPATEVDDILPRISGMVSEGIVGLSPMRVVSHQVKHHLVPRHLKVRDVMTPHPRTAHPTTPISRVLEMLLSADFTGLPIVDDAGRPLGIITDGDLVYRAGIPIRVRLMAQFTRDAVDSLMKSLATKLANEVMTTPVVTIKQDQFLFEAVDVMLKGGLRRLPVVDNSGILVGILSRIDIFNAISQETPSTKKMIGNGVSVGELHRAGDAMRKDTPTVSPRTPLDQVIKLLGNSAIERVAVVDDQGKLVGLISDHAMLNAFSEHKDGVWDYLMRKLSSREIGERHRGLIRRYRSTMAGQIMEIDFPSVGEDTPLDDAVRIMTEKHLKRLPVLDGQGHLLGMLRREALLRMGVKDGAPGGNSR